MILGIVFFTLLPAVVLSQADLFYRNLELGNVGDDVKKLQMELNKVAKTRVSESGPGSIGEETTYFGPLTKDAVIRYQNLYAEEVLHPIGLLSGTGFVGRMTRARLNNKDIEDTDVLTIEDKVIKATEIVDPRKNSSRKPNAQETNGLQVNNSGNQVNLDLFVNEIRKHGVRSGLSSLELGEIEVAVREQAVSGPDFQEEFIRQSEKNLIPKTREEILRSVEGFNIENASSFLPQPIESLLSGFGIGSSQNKLSQAGLINNFGGTILYTFPCVCDPVVWKVLVGLPSPVFADYVLGTQLYLSYTFPRILSRAIGRWVISAPICYVYVGVSCVPVPGEGFITPIVGNSLI